jgi:hypothetical protein
VGVLHVAEYIGTSDGLPIEPPVAEQELEIGREAVLSAHFHQHTRFLCLTPDESCRVAFGQDDPEAGATSRPCRGVEYRALPKTGRPLRLSVVAE